jgi:hypothetical protein
MYLAVTNKQHKTWHVWFRANAAAYAATATGKDVGRSCQMPQQQQQQQQQRFNQCYVEVHQVTQQKVLT